jgi:hypothetical protein
MNPLTKRVLWSFEMKETLSKNKSFIKSWTRIPFHNAYLGVL